MKWNNILHALAAIGCILGIYNLHNAGWQVWQWPAVALMWILVSYINCWSNYDYQRKLEELRKELYNSIDKYAKADTRAWMAEMQLEKSKQK
jgi:hypothetical protein